MPEVVAFSHEHERRLRVGFIGCGDHSFRNVYPVLRYLPVELVAVCDLDAAKAAAYARTFGAERSYTSHHEMLTSETLDAVLVVTGYVPSDDGLRLLHAELCVDVLEAGVSVWVEKPPVATSAEAALVRAAIRPGLTYGVGFKKAFAAANTKLHELVPEPRSISIRYAQAIPTVEQLRRRMGGGLTYTQAGFLDHLCHPLSLLRMLAGPAKALFYERAANGDGFAHLTMQSGAVASLHLTSSFAMRAIQERTEVSGDAGSAWVENNTRVTWAPRPEREDIPPYGRAPTYATAPMGMTVWEPEVSLGVLYNSNAFLLGYRAELQHFCDAVLAGRDVDLGGIDWVDEGVRIYEAFAEGPGKVIELRGAASTPA
jgi:predicted dehydrogenase